MYHGSRPAPSPKRTEKSAPVGLEMEGIFALDLISAFGYPLVSCQVTKLIPCPESQALRRSRQERGGIAFCSSTSSHSEKEKTCRT
jgi:hypothetical protein